MDKPNAKNIRRHCKSKFMKDLNISKIEKNNS